jgi:CelD/BcsL family acetyltransferase involved in cellulose biosynthesis
LQTRVRDISALSPDQVESWNALLVMQPVRSPFLSHAFCRSVHDARGGGRVLQITADDGGCGFLPFQLRMGRALLGHAEKAGGTLSDMFGIVGTLRTALNPQALLRSANLSSLRFDHALEEICPFAFEDREQTSGIRVWIENFASFQNALAEADEQFVGMVGAGERRLAKKFGKIRFEWHAANAREELDRLIAVKREQYRKTGVTDGLAQSWTRKLLYALLDRNDAPHCRTVLSTLHAGSEWVASHLAITCADTFHIWFPAYEPRLGRYGPGHMLLFKMLEQGVREGFRWFDFGQGEATYKSRYRGESYTLWKGCIRRRSILGYSERMLQSLEWRMRKRAAGRREGPALPDRDGGAGQTP